MRLGTARASDDQCLWIGHTSHQSSSELQTSLGTDALTGKAKFRLALGSRTRDEDKDG